MNQTPGLSGEVEEWGWAPIKVLRGRHSCWVPYPAPSLQPQLHLALFNLKVSHSQPPPPTSLRSSPPRSTGWILLENTTSPSISVVPCWLQQEDRSPGNGGPSGDGVEVSTEPLQEQGRGASKPLNKAWVAPWRRPRNGLDKQVRDGWSWGDVLQPPPHGMACCALGTTFGPYLLLVCDLE